MYYDTIVKHGDSPSWRIEPPTGEQVNTAIDYEPIEFHGGDNISISAWIKTNGTTPKYLAGARIGFDVYDNTTRITGANCIEDAITGQPISATNGTATDLNYVHWGSDWTYVNWTFTAPSVYIADGYGGYSAGTSHTPQGLIFWFQIWDSIDQYTELETAWISDTQFYINQIPQETPTATPTPSLTATPSPETETELTVILPPTLIVIALVVEAFTPKKQRQ